MMMYYVDNEILKMSLKTYQSKLSELRQKAELSQAQLAVFIGVTTNTIQNWEKEGGLNQFIKYLKLCEVLECDPKDLIDIEEFENKNNKEFTFEDLKRIRETWGTSVKSKTSEKPKISLNKKSEINSKIIKNPRSKT